MNLSAEASSLSSNPITATLLPLPREAPVFSPAEQHWIQQMIAAQMAQRDGVSDAKVSFSTTLATLASTTSLPAVSTIRNVGEQRQPLEMLVSSIIVNDRYMY